MTTNNLTIEIIQSDSFIASLKEGRTPGVEIRLTCESLDITPQEGGIVESDNLALTLKDFAEAIEKIKQAKECTIPLYGDYLLFEPNNTGKTDITYCVTEEGLQNPSERKFDSMSVETNDLIQIIRDMIQSFISLVEEQEYPIAEKDWYSEIKQSCQHSAS